jgi:hypothetical protein
LNFEPSAVITEDEVVKAIKSLKNNKSCGTDMILNEFLKNSCQKMIDVYVKLFNIVFKSGVIPDLWSVGVICPIYKNKGDTANPDNYRGITILSCYGKLFTAVLNNRLKSLFRKYECSLRTGMGRITLQCNALHYNYFHKTSIILQLQLHVFWKVMHYITITLPK